MKVGIFWRLTGYATDHDGMAVIVTAALSRMDIFVRVSETTAQL